MKWLTRFLAAVGLIVIVLMASTLYLSISSKPIPIADNTVLSVDINDLIEGQSSRSLLKVLQPQDQTLYDFIQTLNHASRDPKIKGLLLYLNNAQLSIAKIQEVQEALKNFRKSGKFAVAYADTYGDGDNGTPTYYLASSCDDIVMQPMGSLNLLGFGMEMPFLKKLMDEWGVKARIGTREEFKSAMETFTLSEMSPESRLEWQTIFNELLSQVVKNISTEREISSDDVRAIIDRSPLYKTEDVLALGLVDHIFYKDECEEYVLKKAGDHAEFVQCDTYQQTLTKNTSAASPKIAVMYGTGAIVRSAPPKMNPLADESVMASDAMTEMFEDIYEDKNVKAIVFRINSPGGSPVASETIRHCIDKAKAKGLNVVVSMGEYAASGGYWVASSANKIVSLPSTITGSIGVFGGKFVFKGLWDKLGIHWDRVQSGQNAALYSSNQDFTDEQWQQNEQELDYIYQSFLQRVADGRHMSLTQARELAKGRIWTGEQALSLGLVDALGGLTTAIDMAKVEAKIAADQAVHIEIFPRKKSLLQEILHKFNGGTTLPAIVLCYLEQTHSKLQQSIRSLTNLFYQDTVMLPNTMPLSQ